ncbi:MAG: hypothetical protein ACKOYM_02815 [Actinomycetes bacterium]
MTLIPKDRLLVLLIAPVLSVAALTGAALLDRGLTPAAARTASSTTVTTAASGSEAAVQRMDLDLSAKAHSNYRADPSADVSDAPAAQVLGSELNRGAGPQGVGPPFSVPRGGGGPPFSVPRGGGGGRPTTTTTIPVPPPVVPESPIAALLPMSALASVGAGVGLLVRRRRRNDR